MKWYQRFGVQVSMISGFWLSIESYFVFLQPLLEPASAPPETLGIPHYTELGLGAFLIVVIVVHLFFCIAFWFGRQYQAIRVVLMSCLLIGLIGSGLCSQADTVRNYKEGLQRENWYKEHPSSP